MSTARIIVIGLIGLVIGVLIGFGFRGSLASLFDLNAAAVPTASVSATDEHFLGLLGVLSKNTDYPNKTAPKAFVPWITPTYATSGLLSEIDVRNLADLKANQLKGCVDDANNGSVADCLAGLATSSGDSATLPLYVQKATFIH